MEGNSNPNPRHMTTEASRSAISLDLLAFSKGTKVIPLYVWERFLIFQQIEQTMQL